jgi:glycerol-3-phosphate acyltransferase PlsY
VALSVALMAMFLLYRHYENINRLIKGTESKLGKKSSPPVAHTAHHGHQDTKHSHSKHHP